jgi:hypothetical protein
VLLIEGSADGRQRPTGLGQVKGGLGMWEYFDANPRQGVQAGASWRADTA